MGNRRNGEGTIYREDSRNRYVGQLYVDGRRRKVTGRTEAEVVDKMNALKRAAAGDEPVPDGNTTVGDVIDRWRHRVLESRDLAPSTRTRYRWALDLLAKELGSKRLRTLDADTIEDALDRIATGMHGRKDADGNPRPLARSSVVRLREALVQVLDFAEKRRMIAHNPARVATVTTAPRKQTKRSLTPDEARLLFAACEGEWYGNLFRLMIATGLRPGEALGLCWDAVDLEAGTLTVRRGVRMKGGTPVLADEVKTAGSRRTIQLPSPAVDALKAQRAHVAAAQLAAPSWSDARLVFPTRRGSLLAPRNQRRELAALCAKAEVPDVTPNELRHTAASVLNDAGVPLERIADLLGHTSTRMLNATYRHRVRPSVDAAVGVMDAVLAAEAGAS